MGDTIKARVNFGYPNAAEAAAALDKYKYYYEFAGMTEHLNQFNPEGIFFPSQFAGASLDLETEVNMRLWFRNIPSGTKFLLQTSNGEDDLSVLYSPMNYCYSVAGKSVCQ
ncbi:MAG: hypothetical protein K6A80_03585 [Saccharofermentans sp.]|nr:hypothetical protein [Saccharofermentans sp.]